jgi:hypothetical protein
MAVAVASAPKLDTHVTDAIYGYIPRPFHGQSFSSYNSGHFDAHHGVHELRCSKCSCLPVDCQCVESHPVGPAYCPNPNETDLPKEYETHVQVFVRVPEMQEVEETHYKKEVCYEKAKVRLPKSVLTYDLVEHFEMVPVVKYVTKTRQEIEYRVSEEEIEITVMEQCVEYEDVCVIRQEPKVIIEEVEEIIKVPVVKEVEVTKMCEEWTGKYCESEVEKFCSPGDFNLICQDSCHQHSSSGHGGRIRRSRSSASSLSGGDSPSHRHSASKPKRSQSMTETDLKVPMKSHSMAEYDLKASTQPPPTVL